MILRHPTPRRWFMVCSPLDLCQSHLSCIQQVDKNRLFTYRLRSTARPSLSFSLFSINPESDSSLFLPLNLQGNGQL
ncbi:hypothetical protein GJAV_G00185370 [Gymnothorax javanicus]|nr:hypothetical protein GJAV_G00185370 [Gymnothorax javanicus]